MHGVLSLEVIELPEMGRKLIGTFFLWRTEGGVFSPSIPLTCTPRISALVDGRLSRGSSVARPRSEDPHQHEWKFLFHLSGLSALRRLDLLLADDFKGKPPHWLLEVNSVWGENWCELMSY